jgi:hypothetical protein
MPRNLDIRPKINYVTLKCQNQILFLHFLESPTKIKKSRREEGITGTLVTPNSQQILNCLVYANKV